MDSPEQFHPTWVPGSSQAPIENSQDSSGASQTISEVLTKNFGKLTLDSSKVLRSPRPEYPYQKPNRARKPQGLVEHILRSCERRTGVRTLLTARKERVARMIQMIQYYQRYLNAGSKLEDLQQKEPEESEPKVERFRCRCHYCLYHKDVSEETSREDNYDDMEPM